MPQAALDPYGAVTHEVINQPVELADYNLFSADRPLVEAVAREGAGWAANDIADFGARIGAADYLDLGAQANRHLPEFDTHDRYGRRIDLVRFHPSYHQLMKTAIEEGLHASPWTDPRKGAHVARAARFYMHSQVEPGHGCPISMTFAAVPCLSLQPNVAKHWLPKIFAREYDPRNVPAEQKKGITIGMAMTEKQGGSDVRANTTRAVPIGSGGPGGEYELVGHKFFVSAPMCDAFLVLAQAPGGLSCFLVPRWKPDGTKNPLQVLRLKKKMGNASNATSETELRGAFGWMVGKEGRGVTTIIEMVAMTRFDCMIGSSAIMRAALSQAIDHCRQRAAFGKLLIDQPMMQNVLADLAIETEAALALTIRIARALDDRADEHEASLIRIGSAIGKYWICKRTPGVAAEAMECIGGSGVMEDGPMLRHFRESSVNAIWEGSGNVQCLDVLRAMSRMPETLDACFAELEAAKGANASYDRHVAALRDDMRETSDFEERARSRRPARGRITGERARQTCAGFRVGRLLRLAHRLARRASVRRAAEDRGFQGDRRAGKAAVGGRRGEKMAEARMGAGGQDTRSKTVSSPAALGPRPFRTSGRSSAMPIHGRTLPSARCSRR